jgi:hypothetical protein
MNEFLPVRFNVALRRARWSACLASPSTWARVKDEFYLYALTTPNSESSKLWSCGVYIDVEDLPANLKPKFTEKQLNRLASGGGLPLRPEWKAINVFECIFSSAKPRRCDPRELRDHFFGLKEDQVSLLEFLNRYGAWQDAFHKGPLAEAPSRFVSPLYFWHYRAQLRRLLEEASRDPAKWFASTITQTQFILQQIPKYPFHSYDVAYARDAIEASFTFDLMKRVPISFCAREDCRKPYFVTRKSKKFCSEMCARRMVMRRARLRTRDDQTEV